MRKEVTILNFIIDISLENSWVLEDFILYINYADRILIDFHINCMSIILKEKQYPLGLTSLEMWLKKNYSNVI